MAKCQDLRRASASAASKADKPIDPESFVQENVDSIMFLFNLHLDTRSDDHGIQYDISDDVPSDDVPFKDEPFEDVTSTSNSEVVVTLTPLSFFRWANLANRVRPSILQQRRLRPLTSASTPMLVSSLVRLFWLLLVTMIQSLVLPHTRVPV